MHLKFWCVWHHNKRNQPINQSVFHVVLRVLDIFRLISRTSQLWSKQNLYVDAPATQILQPSPVSSSSNSTPVTWGSALSHACGGRNSQRSHISFIKIYFTGTDFWVQPVSIRPQQTRNGSFRTIKEVQEVHRAPQSRCGRFPLFWLKVHELTWPLFPRCSESVRSVYRRAGEISDAFRFFHRQKNCQKKKKEIVENILIAAEAT